jgi:hypothetical protein
MKWSELKALVDDKLRECEKEDAEIEYIDISPGSMHIEVYLDNEGLAVH